jgi:hypothetical protein
MKVFSIKKDSGRINFAKDNMLDKGRNPVKKKGNKGLAHLRSYMGRQDIQAGK